MPQEEYYIVSTHYTIRERATKRYGKQYDAVFRIYDLSGKPMQKSIRGATKTEARRKHDEFITNHCKLIDKLPKYEPSKAVAPVADNGKKDDAPVLHNFAYLADAYIDSLSNINRESTILMKRGEFRLFLIPYFGTTPMKDIDKEMLFKWQDNLWKTKNPRTGEYYSYAQLRKIRKNFSAFLSWVETRYGKYGYKNHLTEIPAPKRQEPVKQMQTWTKKQFEKFLAAVDNPKYRVLFTTLFYTGRRKGEVMSLYPADINSTTGKISWNKSISFKTVGKETYKITPTKANKVQVLTANPRVMSELTEYIKTLPPDSVFVFCGETPGTPISQNALTYAFKKYTEKAGLPPIRIHDLRHSFVTMVIHHGGSFAVAAELIGDTIEQVAKTYAHVYGDDAERIVLSL